MTRVTQPIVGVPIGTVTVNGQRFDVHTHPEFQRYFESLSVRVGGPTGPGTPDLTVAQFEDAAIEETNALLSIAEKTAAQYSDAALRAEIEALARRVQSLEQGISL
jgi:hypothetical protein